MFNTFSGAIFQGYYLNCDTLKQDFLEVFEKGKDIEGSGYMKFEKYISDFDMKYKRDISFECMNKFGNIIDLYRTSENYSLMLSDLVSKILKEWDYSEDHLELSNNLIGEIIVTIKKLIDNKFKSDVEKLIIDLKNKIQ